jgi:hypothetical protein
MHATEKKVGNEQRMIGREKCVLESHLKTNEVYDKAVVDDGLQNSTTPEGLSCIAKLLSDRKNGNNSFFYFPFISLDIYW